MSTAYQFSCALLTRIENKTLWVMGFFVAFFSFSFLFFLTSSYVMWPFEGKLLSPSKCYFSPELLLFWVNQRFDEQRYSGVNLGGYMAHQMSCSLLYSHIVCQCLLLLFFLVVKFMKCCLLLPSQFLRREAGNVQISPIRGWWKCLRLS